MKLMATALTIAVVTGLAATGALADGGPTGIWRINSGKVTVKIEECGNALCGTIVDLAKPLDKNGAPKVDRENPDPALRRRPLIGITVLDHMRPNGDNKWSGTIYNADDGYTYSSKMSLNGDIMKVKGCVLFICKAMKFTRVN